MREADLRTILFDYVGFDAESATVLKEVGPVIRPHFEQIVDRFYDAVLADPGARSVLQSEVQVERLRVSLLQWLEGLFTGTYDEVYFEKRSQIGRAHVKVGLEQRYMLTAMNVVRAGLHEALESSADEYYALCGHREIDQICDIELAIMLETYREDYVLKKTAEAQSFATMGKLTAGLAHEIRNPLNAAKLQLDVLRRSAAKVEQDATREKIEVRTSLVQSELRRLSTLLDDFLSLARSRRLEPVIVSAPQLLREVGDLRRPELESVGIELSTQIALEDCQVNGEPDRLKQVVNSLITNAVEAVAGCPSPRIELSSEVVGDERWEVRIRDNGSGVAPKIAERAFESFFTTKEAGTGLGLSIVKRIVELHGGDAALQPLPDGGTCASFWIPVLR